MKKLILFIITTILVLSILSILPSGECASWHHDQTHEVALEVESDWVHSQHHSAGLNILELAGWTHSQWDSTANSFSVTVPEWHQSQSWGIDEVDGNLTISEPTWVHAQSYSAPLTIYPRITNWTISQHHTGAVNIIGEFVPDGFYITSTPVTSVQVNTTYYYNITTSLNVPSNQIVLTTDAPFLYLGTNGRMYGTPTINGTYNINITAFTVHELVGGVEISNYAYQEYQLVVNSVPVVEPPVEPDDDYGFSILGYHLMINDLLIWGVVVFIPIGIVFLFSMLTRNSRR